MGNRGNLHDGSGRIQRRWKRQRWIICLLTFKGRKRQLMTPWTSLAVRRLASPRLAGSVEAISAALCIRPVSRRQSGRFVKKEQLHVQQRTDPMAHGEFTLFDTFEEKGHWWLPEKPDAKVPGVLTRTEKSTTLALFGSLGDRTLSDSNITPVPKPTPLIVGILDNSECCTLYKPFNTGTSYNLMSSEAKSSTWSAPCSIFGNCYFDKIEEVEFADMRINYTDLESWMADSVIRQPTVKRKNNRLAKITSDYLFPRLLKITLPTLSATLTTDHSLTTNSTNCHSQAREHIAFLALTPDAPKSLDWFYESFRQCQNLLTLFIGEAVYQKRILATVECTTTDGPTRKCDVRVYFHHKNRSERNEVHPAEMLMPMPRLKSRLRQVVQSWFARSEAMRDACNLFFAPFFNPGQYVEADFLTLCQALECFSRATRGGYHVSQKKFKKVADQLLSAIPKRLDKGLAESLQGHIAFANQHSLKRRLGAMLTSLNPDTAKLICPDNDQFKKTIVDSRNYYTHRDTTARKKAIVGPDLHYANQRLKLLFIVLLFKELKIPENEIRAIILNNPKWMQLSRLFFSKPL